MPGADLARPESGSRIPQGCRADRSGLAVAAVQPGYGNTAPMQIELDPGVSRSQEDIDKVGAV